MNIQQQRWNYISPYRSKLNQDNRFYEECINHQSDDETSAAHKPTRKRPSSESSPLDQKASEASPIPSGNLPSIQPDHPSAVPQDVPQRAPSAHNVSMRSTPPPSSTPSERRLSGSIGVEHLLNPTAEDITSAGGRQHDGEGTDSLRTAPMAAMSRPAAPSLPSTSMRKHPLGDIVILPSITPALMNMSPHPLTRSNAWQPPSMLPRDQASTLMGSGPLPPSEIVAAPSMLCAAHISSAPQPRSSPQLRQMTQRGPNPSTYPRIQTRFDRPGNLAALANPASRNSSPTMHYSRNSPPSGLPQVASTDESPIFFPAPFTSTGPDSTMPQLAFDKQAFDALTSKALGQSEYQILTPDTGQGPIQVRVDMQAASKVADEKRKRNATASKNFRQRRKEKSLETANETSNLKAQLRKMTEERDFLQDVLLRNGISIPSRASLTGPQFQDTETSAQNGGRNTRRRTSAYVPPQGLPRYTVAAHSPLSV
jgi:hypothetical protein